MAKLLILLVRIYQCTLSGLVGGCCRFYPTCSSYTIDALRRHGAMRGGWMALKRIGKCHPFNPGGVDLVPPSARERTQHPAKGLRPVAGR